MENSDGISGPGIDAIPNLLSFFHDRLKVYLRDQGARHDLIDASFDPLIRPFEATFSPVTRG